MSAGDPSSPLPSDAADDFVVQAGSAESGTMKLDATASAVAAAAKERRRAKIALFFFVLRLGTITISAGLIVYGTRSFVTKDHVMQNCLRALGAFVAGMGILMISTIPLEQFDIDRFVAENKITRRVIVFVLFAERLVVVIQARKIIGALVCAGIASLAFLVFAFWNESSPKTSPRLSTFVVLIYMSIGTLSTKGFSYWDAGVCCSEGNSTTGSQVFVNETCGFNGRNGAIGLAPHPANAVFFEASAGFLWFSAVLTAAIFCRQRTAKSTTSCLGRVAPTLALYVGMYAFYFLHGVQLLFLGSVMIYFGGAAGYPTIAEGVFQVLPAATVAVLGRNRIFGIMMRYFDRSRAKLDGAVMAGLLDRMLLTEGMNWWVPREQPAAASVYPDKFDPRRNWRRGTIVMIKDGQMSVRLDLEKTASSRRASFQMPGKRGSKILTEEIANSAGIASAAYVDGGPVRLLPLPEAAVSGSDTKEGAQALLKEAKARLRCLGGEYLSADLVSSSSQDEASRKVSASVRPLGLREQIDFFISHSWHDPPGPKWTQLDAHRHKFQKSAHRMPTYWFDKCCIDQDNITDGLRVLIVNVQACKKVLVVCGPTYSKRLWCMLELFAVFSFAEDQESALQRVEILPVEGEGMTKESLLASLANFKLSDACCYDPNEEARLRGVMAAVGEERFVSRIRLLGDRLIKREARRMAPPNSQNFVRRITARSSRSLLSGSGSNDTSGNTSPKKVVEGAAKVTPLPLPPRTEGIMEEEEDEEEEEEKGEASKK